MSSDGKSRSESFQPPAAPQTARFNWIPIRSLSPRHGERIVNHLLALDEQARYLRFGHAVTNEQIRRYADTLDFEQEDMFGIFNHRLELIAMAHLAYIHASDTGTASAAEFGVSVSMRVRGRGHGTRLFEHAVIHARNRGCERLFIHALSENPIMLKIARNSGATVERDRSEIETWLKLSPDSIASPISERVEQHTAEINHQFKVHAQRIAQLLGRKQKSLLTS